MSKLALLASFLASFASFMTMDAYIFDGFTTRFVWREIRRAANATQPARIDHLYDPIGHR